MTRPNLPTGTVTFLFTDFDGSTKLVHELEALRPRGTRWITTPPRHTCEWLTLPSTA